MAVLSVDNVTKRYDGVTAVDGVSFQAHPGRILGLLGPNGAGKTSVLRMISHITAPDDGQIHFCGRPVGPWSQQKMGYLPEERGLYKKMKVGDQLLYLARLKGLSKADASKKIQYWLRRVGATDWADKCTEALSKGMQQKIQFIAAVLPDPPLLILDEPFSGLDPLNAELLKDIVLELKEAGRTILFASHHMEQVEQLCEDICLISQGEIVLQGALRDVKRRFGRNTAVVEFSGSDVFSDALAKAGCVRVTSRRAGRTELRLLNGTRPRRVLEAALQHTEEVYRFELVRPSLSDIFMEVVGQQQAAASASASTPG